MPSPFGARPLTHQLFCLVLLLGVLPSAVAAQLPRAVPNDHRASAGHMVDGVLEVSLEAVVAEWRPRGESGPVLESLTFAESGKPPSAPGPMIRVAAGTPIRVTVRNTLDLPIRLGGLGDRGATPAPDAPRGFPPFLRATSVVIAPNETRQIRFTPTTPVTSFYTARIEPRDPAQRERAAFDGAFIVDPADRPPPRDERVMLVSTSGAEGGSPSFKFFVNGLSWPYTERLEYTVGDTVRWRVIVTSASVTHPMHLHGFYYNVEARGDGAADTVYAEADRERVVTDRMVGRSSLRLSWVPSEPGNWLFHCHLIRHMGEAQRFNIERAAPEASGSRPGEPEADHEHPEHVMAGLIMGISVRPRTGTDHREPAPARRIDLWTGTREGVFGDAPELGFVIQNGAVPASDSTLVPGGTLHLHEGEPTRIVVHNRLHFPLSLHWHGLEVRSEYDGVGGWSGDPVSPRPAITPGDSMAVLITPPRAGTFMYHTHGEPGYELAQGLYGGFLVLRPGEVRDPVRDRLFMLGSRGAKINSPPSINGSEQAPTEHFTPGEPVRLRFGHISPDDLKRVRLLRDGQEVEWRLIAKDGADLPSHRQVSAPARFVIGVGETRDVEWTPTKPGLYVLEVRTAYYPEYGGAQIQRVAFAVGAVPEAAITAAVVGTDLPVVALDEATLRSYAGTYRARADATSSLRFYMARGLLYSDERAAGDTVPNVRYMVPLGEDVFAFARFQDGAIVAVDAARRARFVRTSAGVTAVELSGTAEGSTRFERAVVVLSSGDRDRVVGSWSLPDGQASFRVEAEGDGLVLVTPDAVRHPLEPESNTRFAAPSLGPRVSLQVVLDGERVSAIDVRLPGAAPFRLLRAR